MNPNTYISRFFTFSLLIGVAVVGINYTVDPYALMGTKRVSGFNKYKAESNNYTNLMKKYQPEMHQHNALIVGNSRVELGIDPAHQCFIETGLAVYNLGMPGAGVRKQLEYTLNIMYQQPVKTIFLGVDFTDFLSSSPAPAHQVNMMSNQQTGELRYLPSGKLNPEFTQKRAVDYFRALFSFDALVASFKTVALQGENATDRDEAGFNPARDFAAMVRVEGPAALFANKMAELDEKYSKSWYLRHINGQLNQSFEYLREFLAIAAGRGVHVNLFTNPFHQAYWDLLEEHGLLSLYEDWGQSMQDLATIAAEKSGNVAFWDFSENSQYIHEPVPAGKTGTVALKWFWEPAHYRRELGDLMVDTMLSESCDHPMIFGRRVI